MKTHHILDEIISTENVYRQNFAILREITPSIMQAAQINKLNAFDQHTLERGMMLAEKIALHHEEVATIFNELKTQLITPDNTLRQEINHSIIDNIIAQMQSTFAKMTNDYANYLIFHNNFAKMGTFNTPELQEHIKQASGRAHQLQSLLIKPVQRLPRYELLFRDLMRSIPDCNIAKPRIEALYDFTRATCQDIDSIPTFLDNLQNGYLSMEFNNDSRFRREVKNFLDDFRVGHISSAHLMKQFERCGLHILSKGKKFSNKRTFSFCNQFNQTIFDIIVNRNTMSFKFSQHFDALAEHQKVALFKLQYLLTMALENRIQAITPNPDTKHYLEILGEVEYLKAESIPTLALADEKLEDEDEDEELEIPETIAPTQEPTQAPTENEFKAKLNTLLMHNRGLSHQGSFVKPVHNGQSTDDKPTYAPIKWKLPGMA